LVDGSIKAEKLEKKHAEVADELAHRHGAGRGDD
jgi:hypothetical protein